jgi:hypothetical protein
MHLLSAGLAGSAAFKVMELSGFQFAIERGTQFAIG